MPAFGVHGRGQRSKAGAFAARKAMGTGFLMSSTDGSDQLPFNQTRSSSSATVAIPMKRIGNERDIVSIIDYLLTKNSYMTGRNINIDGGKSLG